MKNTAKLIADRITKSFGGESTAGTVLNDVSICFEQGKTYAITGVSGTGKSTLIHIVAGVDVPTAGAVFFNDKDISHFSYDERREFRMQSLGLMFQMPYLIRELTVGENVMLPGLVAGTDQDSCVTRMRSLLKGVGLGGMEHIRPATLSGGQQQRVSLARALFNKPAFLIADEPTGNLDEDTGLNIIDLLVEMQKKHGMGVIVSTHDMRMAERMDEIHTLNKGKLR